MLHCAWITLSYLLDLFYIAGLRVKADLVNNLNRKKLREKQSYDGLLHEYSEVQKLYYQIKYWLERDSKVEAKLMLAELRGRVRRCAAGFFEACDYFHDGSNALYQQGGEEELRYDFPELWDEQTPLPPTPRASVAEEEGGERGKTLSDSLDPSKMGNSPQRKELASVSDKIDEVIRKNQARDKDRASQQSGAHRAENSFCAFEEMDAGGRRGSQLLSATFTHPVRVVLCCVLLCCAALFWVAVQWACWAARSLCECTRM